VLTVGARDLLYFAGGEWLATAALFAAAKLRRGKLLWITGKEDMAASWVAGGRVERTFAALEAGTFTCR
jgi:hypothetical protein